MRQILAIAILSLTIGCGSSSAPSVPTNTSTGTVTKTDTGTGTNTGTVTKTDTGTVTATSTFTPTTDCLGEAENATGVPETNSGLWVVTSVNSTESWNICITGLMSDGGDLLDLRVQGYGFKTSELGMATPPRSSSTPALSVETAF